MVIQKRQPQLAEPFRQPLRRLNAFRFEPDNGMALSIQQLDQPQLRRLNAFVIQPDSEFDDASVVSVHGSESDRNENSDSDSDVIMTYEPESVGDSTVAHNAAAAVDEGPLPPIDARPTRSSLGVLDEASAGHQPVLPLASSDESFGWGPGSSNEAGSSSGSESVSSLESPRSVPLTHFVVMTRNCHGRWRNFRFLAQNPDESYGLGAGNEAGSCSGSESESESFLNLRSPHRVPLTHFTVMTRNCNGMWRSFRFLAQDSIAVSQLASQSP